MFLHSSSFKFTSRVKAQQDSRVILDAASIIILTKLNLADEINLLTQLFYSLSNKSLFQVYEFAFETLWHKRLGFPTASRKNMPNSFQFTVGITRGFAETLLLVLTRSFAGF